MKTVYFIRHAKSSWDTPASDADRPLNNRGINDAHHVGKKLFEKNISCSSIYSSTANRAQTTAQIVTAEMGIALKNIVFKKELYTFNGEEVISFIKKLPDIEEKVLIFGHNPAFTTVINTLGSIKFDNLPTCGVVAIQFKIKKWYDLVEGTTSFYILPKLLGYR